MDFSRPRWFGRRAAIATLLASLAVSWLTAGTALSATPFQLSITSASVSGYDLLLVGTASSPASNSSGNFIVIEWGDGTSTELPLFDTPAPWVWGPVAHTYAAEGTYDLTATLVHSSPQGNDTSRASDSQEITIGDPDPDPTDEPTVDPTDEPTVDPSVDPTVEPQVDPKVDEPKVKPTITRKPNRPALAHTGAETTAAWMGAMFLAIGIVMRTVRFRSLSQVFAGQSIVAMQIAYAALSMTGRIRRHRV